MTKKSVIKISFFAQPTECDDQAFGVKHVEQLITPQFGSHPVPFHPHSPRFFADTLNDRGCPDLAPLKTAQPDQGSFFQRLCALQEARLFAGCILVWLTYAAFLLMLAI